MRIEIQPINGHYNLKCDVTQAGYKCERPAITFDGVAGVSVAADFSAILVNTGGGSYEWRKVDSPEVTWVLQGESHDTVSVGLSGSAHYGQRRDFLEATSRNIIVLKGRSSKYANIEFRTFVSFNETNDWVVGGEQVDEATARQQIEHLTEKGWQIA